MKILLFLKPDFKKILVFIILLFPLGLIELLTVCVDPKPESLRANPNMEYWGCHSGLHRQLHFIPDGIFGAIIFSLTLYIIICVAFWIYDKIKEYRTK